MTKKTAKDSEVKTQEPVKDDLAETKEQPVIQNRVAKNCPFCGKPPQVYESANRIVKEIPRTQISCTNGECLIKPTTQSIENEDEVYKLWNTRKGDA